MAILIITHDLNWVKRFADNVMVMQNGKIVEASTTEALFASPKDAYTIKLLNSMPTRIVSQSADTNVLIEGQNISKQYLIKKAWLKSNRRYIKAVDGISLFLQAGKTLGIVGESGSGKSTLGRCLLRLESSEGTVLYDNENLSNKSPAQLRPYRKNIQIVFQDPFSSLSPRMTVEQILLEGLNVHFPKLSKKEKQQKIDHVLKDVELDLQFKTRYPHEFSGGQRQRIGIARALYSNPEILVLDEATSALDNETEKAFIDALDNLQGKLTIIMIAHRLTTVENCDKIVRF
jgi:microcin C transport system ATP-binding protein